MHGTGHLGTGCILEVMTEGRKGCRLRKGREWVGRRLLQKMEGIQAVRVL